MTTDGRSRDAEEFASLMVAIAGPRRGDELVSHCVFRAGRMLGISRRTALAYWYGERKIVPAVLMDRARHLASLAPPLDLSPHEYREQIAELYLRVERLEAACRARGIPLDD